MTNRQQAIGKFSPTRSLEPKYNPNWWTGLKTRHPLHDNAPTRQQHRATMRKLMKRGRKSSVLA